MGFDRLGDSAITYAKRGWPVFPCDPASKRPHRVLAPHGFRDATTDVAIVERTWATDESANIGIATGAAAGFFVIDIDPRHGGDDAWTQFVSGRVIDTATVRTPSGGRHLYFQMPATVTVRNSAGMLAPGIDVRGEGGYVVAPCSRTMSGGYAWEKEGPISVPPDWIVDRLTNRWGGGNSPIPEGQRNATLTRLAGAMRRRAADLESIEAALQEENRRRCVPPLPEREVSAIARSVNRYAPTIDSALPKEEVRAERVRLRTAADLVADAEAVPPFIIPGYIARECITEITGAPKRAGKTTFVAYAVRAILDGAPFLGLPVAPGPVVWLTEEGPATFSQPLKLAGLLGREDLFYLSRHAVRGRPWPDVIEEVIEECLRVRAILLIIDTLPAFAQMHGDSENNAGDALRALEPLKGAAACGLAVVVIRHERKGGGAVGESGRGSSAFTGAVDICLALKRPEGKSRKSVRLLEGLSRFRETPDALLVDLTDDGYASLGTESDVALLEARRAILDFLPADESQAMTLDQIVEQGAASELSRTTAQKALTDLARENWVRKVGKGRRGDPYRYHLVSAGTSPLETGGIPEDPS
jgi:hypothetical protein